MQITLSQCVWLLIATPVAAVGADLLSAVPGNEDFSQPDVSDSFTPLWQSNATLTRMILRSIDQKKLVKAAKNSAGSYYRPQGQNNDRWDCYRVTSGDNPCRGCIWKSNKICISVWSEDVCNQMAAIQNDFKWCGKVTASTSTSTASSTRSSTTTTSTRTSTTSTSTTSMATTTPSTSTSSTRSSTTSSVTTTSTTRTTSSTTSTSSSTTSSSATSAPTTTSATPTPTSTTSSPPTSTQVASALLNTLNSADWSPILVSQQPDLSYKPSTVYKAPDMIRAIVNMATVGVGSQKLWLGDSSSSGVKYGLTSIAAFLAQSMKETIQYDACDENNWNLPNGYSAANSCGQLGQAYDKYTCTASESYMQCDIDPNKVVVATTNAKWYGAPGPMFAAPKSILPYAPRWNYNSPWCDPAKTQQPFASATDYIKAIAKNDGSASCRDYAGQKAGGWEFCGGGACPNDPAPNFGVQARTDVQGCYFWGRGVIQTTGVCNYGKLNWYLGARAARDGRSALYSDVDFCANPEEVCISTKYPELKWMSGLFYWLNAVQEYDDGTFQYRRELMKFVDGGFQNAGSDVGFIHGVSGIVNRGCANPPNCGTGPLDGGADRAANFQKALRALGLI